jgi:hypothetical protein
MLVLMEWEGQQLIYTFFRVGMTVPRTEISMPRIGASRELMLWSLMASWNDFVIQLWFRSLIGGSALAHYHPLEYAVCFAWEFFSSQQKGFFPRLEFHRLGFKASVLLEVRLNMSTDSSIQGAVSFLATFAPIRLSTLTALFLIISICIYIYIRNTINYRVQFPMLRGVWCLADWWL